MYRDRVRTSSNVLSSTMCAYITNHLARSELRKMDEKEQINDQNDLKLITEDDPNDNDNHHIAETDITSKV